MTNEEWNRLKELEKRIDEFDDLDFEELKEFGKLQELEVE